MYIEGKYINGTDDLTDIHAIRQEVFGSSDPDLSRIYGMNTDMICDELAIHAIARMEGKIVGCGTLCFDGETFLLNSIAVPEEERRKKYGDFIVRMLIDRAFQRGAACVAAYTAEELYPFFHSIGFKEVSKEKNIIRCELKREFVCRECQVRKD